MKKLSTIIKHKLLEELKSGRFRLDYSYKDFLEDSNEYDKISECINIINKYHERDLRFDKEYFDFLIRKNFQIIDSLHHYFQNSEKAKKDYLETSYSYNVLNHFWMIFTVITNNYVVLKDLLITGKDYQAKVIFRNTIELTELCISILGNEDFYNFFKKENKVENPTKNFQTLKYNKIKRTSNKIIKEVKLFQNSTMDEGFWNKYQQMRDDYYDDTSKHIHSNFINLIFNSHVPIINNEELGKTDIVMHNINGVINERTSKNIEDVILYDSVSFMILLVLIIGKHDLYFSKVDHKQDYLTILCIYNWELLKYRKENTSA